MTLKIGTRGSDLALWQAHWVRDNLAEPPQLVIMKTSGDRIQNVGLHEVEGQGFFTKEIENALLDSRVDIAVHSFKDVPTADVPGLSIVAIPERAPVRDVIVRRLEGEVPKLLWGLPEGATVGTSSLRRRAHVLSMRPDLELRELRGNVPTRFGKVKSGELDAVILAEAGLFRLGISPALGGAAVATEDGLVFVPLDVKDVTPAPSQGALALQVRSDDEVARAALSRLHHEPTAASVSVERKLLSHFGGGCHLPLGAYCWPEGDELVLHALVASPDGKVRIEAHRAHTDPAVLVQSVHKDLVDAGAAAYL